MKNGSEVGGGPEEDGSASHVEVASWGAWLQRMVVSRWVASPCLDAAEGRYGEECVCPSDLGGHP